jgi:S1-C subfamily serine protease
MSRATRELGLAGIELDARVAYVDDELDIALVKVAGNGFPFLPLADTSTVRQGDAVFAIGNPGDGMQISVTRGIVSNIGPFPNVGRGTWIQRMRRSTLEIVAAHCLTHREK